MASTATAMRDMRGYVAMGYLPAESSGLPATLQPSDAHARVEQAIEISDDCLHFPLWFAPYGG